MQLSYGGERKRFRANSADIVPSVNTPPMAKTTNDALFGSWTDNLFGDAQPLFADQLDGIAAICQETIRGDVSPAVSGFRRHARLGVASVQPSADLYNPSKAPCSEVVWKAKTLEG